MHDDARVKSANNELHVHVFGSVTGNASLSMRSMVTIRAFHLRSSAISQHGGAE